VHETVQEPADLFFVAAFTWFVKNPNVVGPPGGRKPLLQFRDSFALILHGFVRACLEIPNSSSARVTFPFVRAHAGGSGAFQIATQLHATSDTKQAPLRRELQVSGVEGGAVSHHH